MIPNAGDLGKAVEHCGYEMSYPIELDCGLAFALAGSGAASATPLPSIGARIWIEQAMTSSVVRRRGSE
jgi:hypothetical protein